MEAPSKRTDATKMFVVHATPFPPEARRSMYADKVCHIVRSIIRKQTDVTVGHTEPMEHLTGVRIYLSSIENVKKVLLSRSIDVMGCMMTLTAAPTDCMQSVASDTLIWYNTVQDIRSLYRSYLLEKWFPQLTHHSIDVHANENADVCALVSFPGYDPAKVAALQEKYQGAELFGQTVSASLLPATSDPDATVSEDPTQLKHTFTATIAFNRSVPTESVNDILTSTFANGVVCESEAVKSSPKKGRKQDKAGSTTHSVRFESTYDYLVFRALYSLQTIHTDGLRVLTIDPATQQDRDLLKEPLCLKHLSKKKKSGVTRIFLSGMNPDLRSIYTHIAKELFRNKDISVSRLDEQRKLLYVTFPTPHSALKHYAWARPEFAGRLIRLAIAHGKKNQKKEVNSHQVYAPQVICSQRVALRDIDTFFRLKLQGTMGGFITLEGVSGKHLLAESYTDAFVAVFTSSTCPDAMVCREQLQDKVFDELLVNGQPTKFILVEPFASKETIKEKRMTLKCGEDSAESKSPPTHQQQSSPFLSKTTAIGKREAKRDSSKSPPRVAKKMKTTPLVVQTSSPSKKAATRGKSPKS